MAELRTDTYREYSWPTILSGLLKRNGLAVSLITGGATLVIFILVLLFMGPVVLTATHLGEGSFYRVVPYVAMTIPPTLIALYGLVVFTVGASRFWRETGAGVSDVINLAALWHSRCIRSRIHERRRRRL